MAIRNQTIRWSFLQDNATVATGVNRDLTADTVYVPENSSRAFRSVIFEIAYLDTVTTATNETARAVSIQIDALGFSALTTISGTLTASGENQVMVWRYDATSYFQTNFTGTSHSVQVRINSTGPGTNNATASVFINYDYDDASQTTRIKTVPFLIQSTVGALTTSLASIGSNQIPDLDATLPEASKVYRNISFELWVNESTSANTADPTLGLALDAEAEVTDGAHETQLVSARPYRRIWVRNDMDTTTTHDLKARTSNTEATFNNIGGVLWVTYEYDHDSSTSLINTVIYKRTMSEGSTGMTTSGDASVIQIPFSIQETNPVLVQSGALFAVHTPGAGNINLQFDSQTNQAWAVPALLFCGTSQFIHQRFDSGGSLGVGFPTFARGFNTLTLNAFYSVATSLQLYATVFLNYTSDKMSGGSGVHNHSILKQVHAGGAGAINTPATSQSLTIPESNYYLSQSGFDSVVYPSAAFNTYEIILKKTVGEGNGYLPVPDGIQILSGDAELGPRQMMVGVTGNLKQYPTDPRPGRVDVETSRSIYYRLTTAAQRDLIWWATYHGITYTVAGTLSGYTGDGSGITVDVYRTDTDEKVATATSSIGGGFTTIWYDNTVAIYCVAYQSSTRKGVSVEQVASAGSFDINLSAASGGSFPFF